MSKRTLKSRCDGIMRVIPWVAIFATYLLLRAHFKFNSMKIMMCLVVPIIVLIPITICWITRSGASYAQDKKDANTSGDTLLRVGLWARGALVFFLALAALFITGSVVLAYFTDSTEGKLKAALLTGEAVCTVICAVLLCMAFSSLCVQAACTCAGPDSSLSSQDLPQLAAGRAVSVSGAA
ncbi:hypothetical protein [Neorickettsia sennetsu]|nr:hypothetical protein [Neorickettsia sennetsu]